MRIVADLHNCEGLGMCEAMADQFFEVADHGQVEILNADPAEQDRQFVDAAVRACPVSAMQLDG
jgi:ferredoxin